MDLERAALYAGRIQHLFVVAYNQDTQSFFHISEALSRIMFCNVRHPGGDDPNCSIATRWEESLDCFRLPRSFPATLSCFGESDFATEKGRLPAASLLLRS
jgi:hypothetical protein